MIAAMTSNGVLVLAGPPCAGKSEVGRLLAADSAPAKRIYVEIDALFSLLLPTSDRNRDDRMLAYDAAHVVARLLLEHGRTPVLECTYSRRQQRASLLRAIADVPEAPLWVVEFFVSPDDAVDCFRRREQPTDLDERLVRERAETFPYSTQAHRLVSTAATPDDLAREVASWLRQGPGPVQREVWAAAGKGWD
jgi:predicted kinase